ncbi:hypothetical protein H8356DRAFT_1341884 [Neocallimastix lanati (nom. inval.)]|nr:hypothetical protein H8356DRAFT_1341884 [Neocallimastix sp. JGI-2020a]
MNGIIYNILNICRISDSKNNSIVTTNVVNSSVDKNRVNLSNFLNNECTLSISIIKRNRMFLFKNQIISGDDSKTPFLVRSAGLLISMDGYMRKQTRSVNAKNGNRQIQTLIHKEITTMNGFILELQGAGLNDIVKEVEKKYTTKDKKGNDTLSEEGENKIKKHKMNNFKVLSFLRKLNNKLNNREKLNYLFKGLPEKQLNFLEIRYSISEDIDEILEDMKKQIRNRRIFIPGKNKEKEEEISQISKGKNKCNGLHPIVSEKVKINEKVRLHCHGVLPPDYNNNFTNFRIRYNKNKNKDKGNNYESCDEDDICEKFNNKRSINNKKKRCYLCDSENHLVYNCPFNPKNPHNNIKHIAEQFQKLNISVDEINDIELCYDSDSDSGSSIVKIKEINLIETENSIMETNLTESGNSIKEINLCEISTTLEEEEKNNNDNQYLEFKTTDDTRKFNYDINYCNKSDENNKFKNNNTPDKTENTNIFQKENNINYDLNNYFINGIYDSNEYNNSNYKNLGMNSNICNYEIAIINNNKYNNEISSMNKNNISNNYQNNENENPNNSIQKIIKEYLQIMSFNNTYYENYQKYMKIINQYSNILNVNCDNLGNETDKNVNKK